MSLEQRQLHVRARIPAIANALAHAAGRVLKLLNSSRVEASGIELFCGAMDKEFLYCRETGIKLARERPNQEKPMDLHHPILREFPEHRELIKRLKAGSDQFRKFFEEYHTLDESIYRIEEEIEFATDQETEELKKRRAWLKDQIYHAIMHARSPGLPAQAPQLSVATP